ncbi:hypothetical protein Tco_1523184 [Tanacetum coccineum]
MRGDDEVILSNKEVSDLKDKNNNDEHEIAEIFRIEANLFDYETPLCMKFKEFNYLLKVDAELFSHDIERTKTYEDYESELSNEDNEPWSEDEVPYEICNHVCEPFCFKNRKTKWPTCNSNEDGFCNGGENGKASNNSDVQEKEEEHKERCDLFDNTAHNAPVCKIRRFEMIKYSFGQDEEYVAIKECEYDDLIKTNEVACRTFQEIFLIMEYFVKISEKARILELKRRNMKNTVLTSNTPFQSVVVIKECLDEFKHASGLIPSIPKSTAFFCNVLNHVKLSILNVLPFEEGRLPVKYLGVPLVSSRLKARDCKELVEKVQNRVLDWKNKALSIAVRLKVRPKWRWELVCLPKEEESLWVKWVHAYKLNGRNFWDVPIRGNMSWSWRKILQLRPSIRDFIWRKIAYFIWQERNWRLFKKSKRSIDQGGFFPSGVVLPLKFCNSNGMSFEMAVQAVCLRLM